jgi:hypothetical protein
VVLRTNEAGQPLYVVVLEQKMSKKRAKKCIFGPVFLGVFIDDIEDFSSSQRTSVFKDVLFLSIVLWTWVNLVFQVMIFYNPFREFKVVLTYTSLKMTTEIKIRMITKMKRMAIISLCVALLIALLADP